MQDYRKKHYAEYKKKNIEAAKKWAIKNPEKRKKIAKDSYNRHKEKIKAAAAERARSGKILAVRHFGGECADCGGEFPPCVYDFHHVDGSKEKNPSVALRGSWEEALKELQKCVMICSNCHRLRHYQAS